MDVRPMVEADIAASHDVTLDAFAALAGSMHRPPEKVSAERVQRGHLRIAHLLRTDPGGAWVARGDGGVVGVALALKRDQVWGLSLLTVRPEEQSSGVGRRLLERALDYGSGCRGWIIMSSDDPRALRRYASADFTLLPTARAGGRVRVIPQPSGTVRDGSLDDGQLLTRVSRYVRRASHGPDIAALLEAGAQLLVCGDERGEGFAVFRAATLYLLAATAPEVAADLLRAALARFAAVAPGQEEIEILGITHAQPWAFEVLVEAGLELRVSGAVFVKGEVGPMTPYVPSGAYL